MKRRESIDDLIRELRVLIGPSRRRRRRRGLFNRVYGTKGGLFVAWLTPGVPPPGPFG